MAGTFRIARIFGFDVNVHWSWAFIFALLTYTYGTDLLENLYPDWTESRRLVVGGAVAIIFFLSILLHELSHSLVARRYGLPVGSITLFIFGGVSNLTKEPENSRQEFWIAFVGPLTSLVLGGLFGLAYLGLHPFEKGIAEVGLHLAAINVVLAVFNLIPGFPLDGGRVLRSLFWARKRNMLDATKLAAKVGQYVAYGMMGLGVLALLYGAVFLGIWLFIIGNFLRSSSAASYEELFVETVLRGVPASAVANQQYTALSPQVTLSELVEDHVLAGTARAYPVMAGQELLGLVTLSDLRAIPREQWPTTTVFRAMTPFSKLRTVAPNDDLPDVLRELAAGDVNQIPMVDGPLLLGLIHRGDVIRYIQTRQALGGTPLPVRREQHPSP
jgi:Zn-dependent protease/CBS domain-containing protein